NAASPIIPVLSVDQISIPRLLRNRALSGPDDVFCIFKGEKITIGTLESRANKIANGLLSTGLQEGDRIAVMMENHPDYVALIFAAAKIGLIWIPVNIGLK